MTTDETTQLTARVDALDRALAVADGRVPPATVERVSATIDVVRARLALGVDHTVVALVGGTGSGKSSLFNAISGLQFADVGVRRPTTSEITACVWGNGAEALLDWLGVLPERRIARESLLDGESEASLRGLVLLDLPDHDSIAPEHREVVDRLIPQADLLAWVVDPQKYADDALHTGYLRQLVGHESSMVVVLNQVDTVPPEVRPALIADLERLLVDDGLTGVPVTSASATTGEGIKALRAALAGVVASQSLAARHAGTEINDAVAAVEQHVAAREPTTLSVAETVESLTRSVGLSAVAGSVATAVRGGSPAAQGFGAVQEDAVGLARELWLRAATHGMPKRWAQDIGSRIASTAELRMAVADAISELSLTTRRSALALGLLVAALVLAVAAVVLGAVAVGSRAGDGGAGTWAPVVAVVALVAAVAAFVASRAARSAAARRRSDRVLRDGRAVLESVCRARLLVPTEQVLTEHRTVRELVASARG
ncbi:GTPase [Cellulomonas sp. URHE0023]|uniref:GTPase n=1 Tax=Cellulomonas sp. URHE0023 TaxID=1380354 RepID=UPI000557F2E0|nr:GTPase [Cellulomonas sp. URHE0023]